MFATRRGKMEKGGGKMKTVLQNGAVGRWGSAADADYKMPGGQSS